MPEPLPAIPGFGLRWRRADIVEWEQARGFEYATIDSIERQTLQVETALSPEETEWTADVPDDETPRPPQTCVVLRKTVARVPAGSIIGSLDYAKAVQWVADDIALFPFGPGMTPDLLTCAVIVLYLSTYRGGFSCPEDRLGLCEVNGSGLRACLKSARRTECGDCLRS